MQARHAPHAGVHMRAADQPQEVLLCSCTNPISCLCVVHMPIMMIHCRYNRPSSQCCMSNHRPGGRGGRVCQPASQWGHQRRGPGCTYGGRPWTGAIFSLFVFAFWVMQRIRTQNPRPVVGILCHCQPWIPAASAGLRPRHSLLQPNYSPFNTRSLSNRTFLAGCMSSCNAPLSAPLGTPASARS